MACVVLGNVAICDAGEASTNKYPRRALECDQSGFDTELWVPGRSHIEVIIIRALLQHRTFSRDAIGSAATINRAPTPFSDVYLSVRSGPSASLGFSILG